MVPTSWTNSVAVGVKTMVGLRWTGIFLTASRASEMTEPWAKVVVAPSGFQSSLSVTMSWPWRRPLSVGFAGERRDGLGPFGVRMRYSLLKKSMPRLKMMAWWPWASWRVKAPALTSDSVPRKISLAESRGVPRFHCFDDEGVAGFCHGAGAPVAGYEEGVFVDPGDVLFGAREGEAVGDEVSGFEVELAQGVGVFAAGGEGDEAEAVAGIEAAEAMLDPASGCRLWRGRRSR